MARYKGIGMPKAKKMKSHDVIRVRLAGVAAAAEKEHPSSMKVIELEAVAAPAPTSPATRRRLAAEEEKSQAVLAEKLANKDANGSVRRFNAAMDLRLEQYARAARGEKRKKPPLRRSAKAVGALAAAQEAQARP